MFQDQQQKQGSMLEKVSMLWLLYQRDSKDIQKCKNQVRLNLLSIHLIARLPRTMPPAIVNAVVIVPLAMKMTPSSF